MVLASTATWYSMSAIAQLLPFQNRHPGTPLLTSGHSVEFCDGRTDTNKGVVAELVTICGMEIKPKIESGFLTIL